VGYQDDTDRLLLAMDERTELAEVLARDHHLRADAERLGLSVEGVVAARQHLQRASHAPESFLRAMVSLLKDRTAT
jgi:hypothetical protein